MWRALKIAWRIAWGIIEIAVVLYVLGAIKDRSTGIVVSVLGLIYATIRVQSLNLGHAFVLLGHGLEQRFYDLERHLDPQTQRSAPDPAFGRFYTDASISSAFIALVYLICLLNVFSRL
jgi:hypothetical protein